MQSPLAAACLRKQSAEAIDAALETVEDVARPRGRGDARGLRQVQRRRARRRARASHPRTGETMNIAATVVPKFTAGSSLKQAVRK